MKRKVVTAFLLSVLLGILSAGCGKEEQIELPEPEPIQETVMEEEEPEEETGREEEEPEDLHEGEALSPFTGEWIKPKIAKQRPVSCMIGNTTSALPQYGIGKADVIYEAPVEGGLTRLMGIFQDYKKIEKLGSVRSSRLYYAYYSQEFDAIYLHYGQAAYATSFLESGQIDDLNGLESTVDQAVIYRDTSKSAPHNAYATGEGLQKGIELKNYSTDYDSKDTHYLFASEEEPVELTDDSRTAKSVKPGYLINTPEFVYDKEDGLYYRFQYGDRHIDGNTNEQLTARNIIIQNSNVRTLDENGYLEIDTTGEGSGQFITGGKAIDITWKRSDVFSKTQYFDKNGNEITLNPGKTWVCIVDNSYLDRVVIE